MNRGPVKELECTVHWKIHSVLSWIWLPLTTSLAPHTAAHHLWTASPIMHCTHTFPSTITPITQLSPSLISLDCLTSPAPHSHTHTFKQHSYMHSPRSLVLARLTFLSVIHPAICYLCVWPRTARPWNSEPVPVTPTSAWYCLRLCPASDIPVFARWPCLFDSVY